MIRTEGDDRLRSRAAVPDRLVGFHTPEKIADGLADGLNNVGPRRPGRRRFLSQEILTALQAGAGGLDCHPRFGTCANGFFVPDILLQALACQPTGKSPFIRIELADFVAENS